MKWNMAVRLRICCWLRNTSKEVTAVKQLIKFFGDAIVGVSSGFDRIVFQGMIRPLMYPEGAMGFFHRRRIRFVDAKKWVVEQTNRLISAVEQWSLRECGERITYLPSSNIRKETVARQRQQEKEITVGPIGVWSCVEAGGSYRLAPAEGAPVLRYANTRCKHLYLYMDHEDYGFMSIRIQTWFPYRIQIAMNGREWLARQLAKAGIGFERQGNKILQVEDIDTMQLLLNQQLNTNWCSLLDSFVPIAFPTVTSTLGMDLKYTWNLWQSEWATDFLFKDRHVLADVMNSMVRHAFIGGHPDRLLHYFGQPTKRNGQPRRDFGGSLKSNIIEFDNGYRVRHWLNSNSVKMYCFLNVLRLEATINDPSAFRAPRRKQGAGDDAPLHFLPLRKGVADTYQRAQVSQDINDRFADHLASTRSSTPLLSVLETVTKRKRIRRRSVRALEPTGKDLELLSAIADPSFTVGGFCNMQLRQLLADTERYAGKTEKQRSGITTRSIRLLRDHGIIRRLPKARRYQLTSRGRLLVTALLAALAASTEELTAIAA
jgi:hypothetical protein